MKLKRTLEIETSTMQLGDQIEINCGRFGIHTATCHKDLGDGVYLIIFDDYAFRSPRLKAGEMLKTLKKEIDPELAELITGGLRLLTYGEMFGHDEFYEEFEPDDDEQLPLMRDAHMRAASHDNEPEWGWLQNARKRGGVVSSAYFAVVDYGGIAYSLSASNALGVRPAFEIRLS